MPNLVFNYEHGGVIYPVYADTLDDSKIEFRNKMRKWVDKKDYYRSEDDKDDNSDAINYIKKFQEYIKEYINKLIETLGEKFKRRYTISVEDTKIEVGDTGSYNLFGDVGDYNSFIDHMANKDKFDIYDICHYKVVPIFPIYGKNSEPSDFRTTREIIVNLQVDRL